MLKNLADLKIILLNHENNYVDRLNIDDNAAKSINSSNQVEHPNYFDSPAKWFSDLSLAKFLDTSAKSFFSCDNALQHLDLNVLDTFFAARVTLETSISFRFLTSFSSFLASVQTLQIDLFHVCQWKEYCVEIEQESRDREIVLVFLTHLESRRQALMNSNDRQIFRNDPFHWSGLRYSDQSR